MYGTNCLNKLLDMPYIEVLKKTSSNHRKDTYSWWNKKNRKRSNTKKRKTRQEFYNSRAWHKLSEEFRMEHPICERCWEKFGKVKQAECVHHHKSFMRADGTIDEALTLDKNNLHSLCSSCHSTIHYHKQLGILDDFDRRYID